MIQRQPQALKNNANGDFIFDVLNTFLTVYVFVAECPIRGSILRNSISAKKFSDFCVSKTYRKKFI
jgi:hypothetical protein